MNSLIYLENIGFKVCWKLIKIGLCGDGHIPIVLTYDEILDYLDDLLSNNTIQTEHIIALICEKDNTEKFNQILWEFAFEENTNITLQKRKWIAYLLNKTLDALSKDCLQGMLELTEFWVTVGNLKVCPMTFPEKNNSQSINEFFSRSSYEINLEKNQKWLNKEIDEIVALEVHSPYLSERDCHR